MRDVKGITFALIAVFLWSTVATAFKLALREMTPLALVIIASRTSSLSAS